MKYIFYHHTGDSSPDPQFAKVNAYHKSQGFPKSSLGYYVGYTFFIGKDGTEKQARGETEHGAHTVNCGCKGDKTGLPFNKANIEGIGICLSGDFLKEKPTSAQIETLTRLTIRLQAVHNIPDENIFLHSETKSTSCPGTDLRALYFVHRAEIMKVPSRETQIKQLEKAIARSTGQQKEMYQRKLERLLKRG